jgi:hypothetical protein
MTREDWLKQEIAKIKEGGTIRLRCMMATSDRVALALCNGDVPEDRAHRGLDTCSSECQADKKRLRRWETAKKKCRVCGHGFTKKERAELKALRIPSDEAPMMPMASSKVPAPAPLPADPFPETGNEES